MALSLKDTIKPISYIKSNTAKVIKFVNETKSPMIITQKGEAKAVIMDADAYQMMQDSFAMLNIVRLAEDDIAHGRVRPAKDVFDDLLKKNAIMVKEYKERQKALKKNVN